MKALLTSALALATGSKINKREQPESVMQARLVVTEGGGELVDGLDVQPKEY